MRPSMQAGKMSDVDWRKSLNHLARARQFRVDDSANITISEIRSCCRLWKISALVIDYLAHDERSPGLSRQQEVPHNAKPRPR